MTALVVCLAIIGFSMVLAWLSGRGKVSGDLHSLMVGSRSFGAFLLFFISVGEIYGIGTMIGVPGAVYSRGSTYAVWFLGYILLAYPVGYILNPMIWRVGKLSQAVTFADAFRWRFASPRLEVMVAIIGIIIGLPWLQMQFIGLGVISKYLGLQIDYTVGVAVSAFIAFFYIAVSGIKASAWVAVVKDFLMVIAIVIGGVVAAVKMPGGVEGIFRTAAIQFPTHLTVPASDTVFALSTIVFQSVGFYMSAFAMQYLFTGKNEDIVRRNQIIMPLYMLMYPFLITVAFFSLVTTTKLKQADEAFMAVIVQNVPGWVVGVVAAGGALTCILVIAAVSLAIGGVFSKNLVGNFSPQAKPSQVAVWTRIATGVTIIVSVALTLFWPNLMLGIINITFFGVTQFFPAMLAILFWKRATKWGVGAGLIVGIAAVILFNIVDFAPYGVNKGIPSLILNFITLVVVSYATSPDARAVAKFEELNNYDDRVEQNA